MFTWVTTDVHRATDDMYDPVYEECTVWPLPSDLVARERYTVPYPCGGHLVYLDNEKEQDSKTSLRGSR